MTDRESCIAEIELHCRQAMVIIRECEPGAEGDVAIKAMDRIQDELRMVKGLRVGAEDE